MKSFRGSMPKIQIYTKSYCPYCDRAKALFKNKGVTFEEISVESDPELYSQLKQKTGMMTVPQIFINDELIGGYTDLAELDQKGLLDPKLNP
jgi:GrxC family glutaredoxin